MLASTRSGIASREVQGLVASTHMTFSPLGSVFHPQLLKLVLSVIIWGDVVYLQRLVSMDI